ncbi:hypothetical protein HOC87_00980 [Candidatus Bathyarchaeota archaeon]|jgi:hypothetical protein|nr:hypothetical protein [Candidatus Bathyarchaeota archaeon]
MKLIKKVALILVLFSAISSIIGAYGGTLEGSEKLTVGVSNPEKKTALEKRDTVLYTIKGSSETNPILIYEVNLDQSDEEYQYSMLIEGIMNLENGGSLNISISNTDLDDYIQIYSINSEEPTISFNLTLDIGSVFITEQDWLYIKTEIIAPNSDQNKLKMDYMALLERDIEKEQLNEELKILRNELDSLQSVLDSQTEKIDFFIGYFDNKTDGIQNEVDNSVLFNKPWKNAVLVVVIFFSSFIGLALSIFLTIDRKSGGLRGTSSLNNKITRIENKYSDLRKDRTSDSTRIKINEESNKTIVSTLKSKTQNLSNQINNEKQTRTQQDTELQSNQDKLKKLARENKARIDYIETSHREYQEKYKVTAENIISTQNYQSVGSSALDGTEGKNMFNDATRILENISKISEIEKESLKTSDPHAQLPEQWNSPMENYAEQHTNIEARTACSEAKLKIDQVESLVNNRKGMMMEVFDPFLEVARLLSSEQLLDTCQAAYIMLDHIPTIRNECANVLQRRYKEILIQTNYSLGDVKTEGSTNSIDTFQSKLTENGPDINRVFFDKWTKHLRFLVKNGTTADLIAVNSIIKALTAVFENEDVHMWLKGIKQIN